MNFRLKKGVILRKRSCSFRQPTDILVRIKNGVVFVLDKKTFNFLKEFDGHNNFEAIAKIYFKLFQEKLTLKQLARNTLLNRLIETGNGAINRNQIIEVKGLAASCRGAIWHLTNICNLYCKHCYYINKKETQKHKFGKKQVDLIVNNLHKLGLERVVLSGGEPLLFPDDLDYVCSKLNEKCIFFTINTNATSNIRPLLKIFKKYNYAENVQVSIDGDKEAHEKIRGVKGCFAKTISSIKKLIKAGIKVKVVSMVSKDWINKEKKIFKIVNELGIEEWLIEIPTLTGNWTDNHQKLGLTQNQLLKVVKEFKSLVRTSRNTFKKFSVNQIYYWPKTIKKVSKKLSDPICLHDLGLLTFGPEGISFCSLFGKRFGKKYYNMAAATTSNLKQVWNSIAKTRINHKIGDNICCRKCKIFKYCQGGCPGQFTHSAKFSGCDLHSRRLAEIRMKVEK